MGNRANDLTGKVFKRLTVIRRVDNHGQFVMWECECECGESKTVRAYALTSGHTKSCGCLHKEVTREKKTTHGMHGTPAYISWNAMLGRCFNKNNPAYERYGGRGITVCGSWAKSFEHFHDDMGDRLEGMSIDRIDNNGDYELSNCKWSTREEQQNNMSTNILLSYSGKTLTLSQWSRELGVPRRLLSRRYEKGWSAEEILVINTNSTLGV